MTASEAYLEAQRRIHAAKQTGQHWLDLGDIENLEAIPEEIGELKELRELGLGDARFFEDAKTWGLDENRWILVSHLKDLTPLARLTALQSIYLSCHQVSDLSPLESLCALQLLDLNSTNVSDLSPLANLRALQSLNLGSTNVSNLSPLADLTALQSLNLNYTKISDLSPLANLRALQSLNLGSTKVSNLSPLANLTALQSLNLNYTKISDLSPLAGLSALQSLSTHHSTKLQRWEALLNHANLHKLEGLNMGACGVPLAVVNTWPKLKILELNEMAGVPPEVLSEEWGDNSLPRLRAWQQDLAAGEMKDQEVKVFVLGNGTAGKTQLCRQLRGLGYDESIPSTHAVQFTDLEVMPDAGSGAVKARLWDFGGQDIYHGTHALFLEGRAVFVLVWNPEVEASGAYEEGGLSLHHHSLIYWLDYVRSLAGEDAAIVVAQSKCDREKDRATPPVPVDLGFQRPPAAVTCSAKEGEIDELKAALRSATRYLLGVHGSYRLPTSWVTVKERLQELRLTQKTMPRDAFEELCRETHGTSVPAALLTYLHRCGEVFYRENLFRDEIVLDQEWAVRAIYAVVDRKGACQQLRQMGGVFPVGLLNTLAWQGEYTADEQKTLVGMMESCSIAFPLSYTDNFSARWMAVPDLLPLEKDVQNRVQALWHEGVTVETVTLEYDFLHSGILREFLCQIGRQGGTNAAYWRYGCCFYDAKTRSRARVRAQLNATPENPGRGVILIETCEGQSGVLLEQVQKAILNIRLGPKPRVVRPEGAAAAPERSAESSGTLQQSLNIQPAPTEKPLVYLSYAWCGEKEKLVDRLEARLIREGYEVKRDNRSTRPGDWISQFMIEIGRAERVCVVLSEKYLRSIYCMRELCFLYERSLGEKDEFLSKIVPLVLEDAAISKVTDRLKHVKHWECELKELKEATTGVDPCNWGGAAEDMAMISSFCHHTEKMLRHASDYLLPRGIAKIEKDDFAAVLEALTRKN